MNQTCTFCSSNICTQFRCHNACQVCNLNGVLQHVLTVAGAVTHTSQKFNHIWMHAVYVGFQNSTFAVLFNLGLNFTLRFFNHFFDSCWMNTSILNQAFQCSAGNLSLHSIMAGKGDCFRCIVNNQIHTGKGFQCADISSFTTDNAAFHFIVWQRNYRNSYLTNIIGSTFLNCSCNNFLCFLLRFILELLLIQVDLECFFVYQFIFQAGKQIFFCLLCSITGNFFKHFKLVCFNLSSFL